MVILKLCSVVFAFFLAGVGLITRAKVEGVVDATLLSEAPSVVRLLLPVFSFSLVAGVAGVGGVEATAVDGVAGMGRAKATAASTSKLSKNDASPNSSSSSLSFGMEDKAFSTNFSGPKIFSFCSFVRYLC